MAILIKPNGSIEPLTPADGEAFSLKELQDAVEGYIEVVPNHRLYTGGKLKDHKIPSDAIMIINEEGKLEEKPVNMIATGLYRLGAMDAIVGNALIVQQRFRKNSEGEPEDYMF